jgi:hypothetical protein
VDVAISSDGAKSFVLQVEEAGGDLMCVYNDASANPTTTADIDTVGVYSITGFYGQCKMSADGETIFVVATSTDGNFHCHKTTDGADGTWSEVADINPVTSSTRSFHGQMRATASFADMVVCSSLGLWISDDSGVTWTEDVTLPYGQVPISAVMTADGNTIYAVRSTTENVIYKTTDKGTTWTKVTSLTELNLEFGSLGSYEAPNIDNLMMDSSDNLYAVSTAFPQDTDYNGFLMAISYSDDAGATFTNSYLFYVSSWDGSATVAVPYTQIGYSCDILPDGSKMWWSQYDAADLAAIMTCVLTEGNFPPHLAGEDWKMVAD